MTRDPAVGARVVVVARRSPNRDRAGVVTTVLPAAPHPAPRRLKPGESPPMLPSLVFVTLDGDWWNRPYTPSELEDACDL